MVFDVEDDFESEVFVEAESDFEVESEPLDDEPFEVELSEDDPADELDELRDERESVL